jgi:CHASE3 domain sensor protein
LLVAIGVVAAVWLRAFGQIQEAGEARARAVAVIDSADDLLSELRDAETGQRGYLLTGDQDFLKPYLAVRRGIPAHLEELRRLTKNRAADQRLDVMAPLIEASWTSCRRSSSCAAAAA